MTNLNFPKNKVFLMTFSLLTLTLLTIACTESGTGIGGGDGNTPEVTEQPAPTTPNTVASPTTTPVPTPAEASPTPEATPASTEPPVIEATPAPQQEWQLSDVRVDSSTVTVVLQVFAGVQIDVTLDGTLPDMVNPPNPMAEYVFSEVEPGTHTLEIIDVAGNSETREITVSEQTDIQGIPDWLGQMIGELESEPPSNPPQSIFRYEYQGEIVYYLTPTCCDLPSDLYHAEGSLLGHPDGGFTGSGDGNFPDFAEERSEESQVWQDSRENIAEENKYVLAPIEAVQLNIAESLPLQYSINAAYGLPSGCADPGGYTVTRDGNRVLISLYIQIPGDPETACTLIYRTDELDIPLGNDFDANTTYQIDINGNSLRFQAGQVLDPLVETPEPPSTPEGPSNAQVRQLLDENRQRWESAGPSSYEMEFRWNCFCPTDLVVPVIITVQPEGIIESVVSAEDGGPVDQTAFREYETVGGLFDLIQEGLDQNGYQIAAEFDGELGYPTSAYIDYDQLIADEELGFSVSSLTELE